MPGTEPMHVPLIDNYDSFTWNLVHYLGELGAEVDVHRNDEITRRRARQRSARTRSCISPGPCTPNEAGICLELIERLGADIADPRRLPRPSGDRPGLWRRRRARAQPVHGKLSAKSTTAAKACLRGINGPFAATRYHSLVDRARHHAEGSRRHRRDRRRAGHGAFAQAPSGARRAVPSRKHRLRARPARS